jgi:DNA-binding MarR family transcriptional regulator
MYDPPESPHGALLRLIDEVPSAFFRLSAMAERLHQDIGIAGPARGVLRTLFLEGEHTAPDLARRKPVTRQAVQPILDDLLARGLVAARDNPKHRRSRLYALTKEGIELCVTIQRRELEEISFLSPDLDPDKIAAAVEAMRQLNATLADRLDIPR